VLAIAKLSITLQDIPLEKQRNYCDTYVIRAPGAAEEKKYYLRPGEIVLERYKITVRQEGEPYTACDAD
jgi:hypothetical protein